MMAYKSAVLLFLFIATFIINVCETKYITYYIEDYCTKNRSIKYNLQGSELETSLLLASTRKGHRLSNKMCSVRVLIPNKVDGVIVSVANVSISNKGNNCSDFLQFGSSTVTKWCNSSQAQSLIFLSNSINITFHVGTNSVSSFILVFTPYEKPFASRWCTDSSQFKCEGSGDNQCISKSFKCDQIKNCPTGNDESGCKLDHKYFTKSGTNKHYTIDYKSFY